MSATEESLTSPRAAVQPCGMSEKRFMNVFPGSFFSTPAMIWLICAVSGGSHSSAARLGGEEGSAYYLHVLASGRQEAEGRVDVLDVGRIDKSTSSARGSLTTGH